MLHRNLNSLSAALSEIKWPYLSISDTEEFEQKLLISIWHFLANCIVYCRLFCQQYQSTTSRGMY